MSSLLTIEEGGVCLGNIEYLRNTLKYPTFYLGFYFETVAAGTSQAEIYIGDFTLYESTDANKINLFFFTKSYTLAY